MLPTRGRTAWCWRIIKHGFTTIPGVLWVITAAVLFFYRLNRRAYKPIVREIRERETV